MFGNVCHTLVLFNGMTRSSPILFKRKVQNSWVLDCLFFYIFVTLHSLPNSFYELLLFYLSDARKNSLPHRLEAVRRDHETVPER